MWREVVCSERPAMSDTPRTDAAMPDLDLRPYTLDWQRAQRFARQLERELNDTHHTIESLRASLRELVGLLDGSTAQNALQRAKDLLP